MPRNTMIGMLMKHFGQLRSRASMCLDHALAGRAPDARRRGVLIVRLDAIGDFVIWLGAARHLRRYYEGERIVLFANSAWAGLAREIPFWDEVVPVDVRRLAGSRSYRAGILRKARQTGCRVAVHPTFSRDFHGDMLIKASGADERLGQAGDLANISAFHKSLADKWYSRLVVPPSLAMTEIERNAVFTSLLIGETVQAELANLSDCLGLPAGGKEQSDYLVVFPGASTSKKQWPIENFASVAALVARKYNCKVVVAGGPDDVPVCKELVEHMPVPATNRAGTTTLLQFAVLLHGARLVLCNDTSAAHIAAATQTPCVCVLGGGHFGRFLPYPTHLAGRLRTVSYQMPCYGCGWACSRPTNHAGAVPCVTNVPVESVVAAAVALLEPDRQSQPAEEAPKVTGEATPLLSIVTVNLDNAIGLARTLRSLRPLRNTPGVEFVLVDGGSRDSSLAVASDFYREDELLSERDSGIYEAMNKGLRLAKGKYVLWLNSGDELLPGAWHAVRTRLLTTKSDVVAFGVEYVRPDGDFIREGVPSEQRLPTGMIEHPGAVVRRQTAIAAGGYDASYKLAGDREFFVRLYRAGAAFEYPGVSIARFYTGGRSSGDATFRENIRIDGKHRVQPLRRRLWRIGLFRLRALSGRTKG